MGKNRGTKDLTRVYEKLFATLNLPASFRQGEPAAYI